MLPIVAMVELVSIMAGTIRGDSELRAWKRINAILDRLKKFEVVDKKSANAFLDFSHFTGETKKERVEGIAVIAAAIDILPEGIFTTEEKEKAKRAYKGIRDP